MLIMALKAGHDGTVAVIEDGSLSLSLETEKDSFARYSEVSPVTVLQIADQIGRLPDVIALSGWDANLPGSIDVSQHGSLRETLITAPNFASSLVEGFATSTGRGERISAPGVFGAGYLSPNRIDHGHTTFFGKETRYFSSSHVRSHIFAAIGLAPPEDCELQAVLVWEGFVGSFYLVDGANRVERTVPVLAQPGPRFVALFAICDPSFPAEGGFVRLNDSGKLMALAAFGDAESTDPDVTRIVDRLMTIDSVFPIPKHAFRESPLFNCGVHSELATTAAAVLTKRIFQRFAEAALHEIPAGIPLRISGGCGLNCDWNAAWKDLGHFSSVFVPPCPNDSGSAIGTAIDAHAAITGSPYIDWDVYAGLEFVKDGEPSPMSWRRRPLDQEQLAQALVDREVVAWVQGRWEIGPRALGNRSLLAEPFHRETRDRLNTIKGREDYRPVAPCARVEDLATVFDKDFEDPYMLYFRRVQDPRLEAITHVDGSARVQTVSSTTNPLQHSLLTAFARNAGVGVLCNTSLNFHGRGFINRMSHLVGYCEHSGIENMVVGNDWYQRIR